MRHLSLQTSICHLLIMMSHQIDFCFFKSRKNWTNMNGTKYILAFFHLSTTFSDKDRLLEIKFELGKLKLCLSPCKQYVCTYLLKHINFKSVLTLQTDPWIHSHGCTMPVQSFVDSKCNMMVYYKCVLSLYRIHTGLVLKNHYTEKLSVKEINWDLFQKDFH